jgi:hypothetical protein
MPANLWKNVLPLKRKPEYDLSYPSCNLSYNQEVTRQLKLTTAGNKIDESRGLSSSDLPYPVP